MLRVGGSVGDCLCAYAFTENTQYGYAYNGITLTIGISAVASGSYTGTLVSFDYDVLKFVGGVVVGGTSGTLLSGGSTNWVDAASDATYRLSGVLTFSDGVDVYVGQIIETRTTGAICVASLGKGIYLNSLDCDIIDVSIPTANATCSRTFSGSWVNGELATIGTGLSFSGQIHEGVLVDFGFVGDIDLSQWVDLPTTGTTAFVYYGQKGGWCSP